MIKVEINAAGISNLKELIDFDSAQSRKDLADAIRGEAFSMRESLKNNIKFGAPSPSSPFKPLSIIARTVRHRRTMGVRAPFPLRKLASAVTYYVKSDKDYTVKVGFPKEYARTPLWARQAALMQQTGFIKTVTPRMREWFASQGERRGESRSRRQQRISHALFLRKSTTTLKIPPRPIIAPFWEHSKSHVVSQILAKFRLKRAGQKYEAGTTNIYKVGSLRYFWGSND
jgi:hypothetical protein